MWFFAFEVSSYKPAYDVPRLLCVCVCVRVRVLGPAAGYQLRPQVVDRELTIRYGGQLRDKRVSQLSNKQS